MKAFELRIGHVVEELGKVGEGVVDCCVTSPPYWGLRDYEVAEQEWGGEEGCSHRWGERHSVRDIREERIYGEETRRFDGNHQKIVEGVFCEECGGWRGSLGLEPTPELYVEHVVGVFREVRRVLKPRGTLWLVLGDGYAAGGKGGGGSYMADRANGAWADRAGKKGWRGAPPGFKAKDLVGIPWMVAFGLRATGWWLRSDIIWHKPNPRPESVGDRPTRSHEYIFLLSKSARYDYDADVIRERAADKGRVNGREGRTEPPGARPPGSHARTFKRLDYTAVGRNKRDVWTISTAGTPEAHFATFPMELAETCILAGSPAGGLVLDPFSGAGTTGLAAVKHGRRYLGIELNPEYGEMTAARGARRMPLLLD